MSVDLSQVIYKRSVRDRQAGNLHINVHPFYLSSLYMLIRRGEYGQPWEEPLPERLHSLVDRLWDNIPGLQTLFLGNGVITIQHAEVFSDEDILELAHASIDPVLQENAKMMALSAMIH